MIPEEDWYGSYSSCLSCGYVYESGAAAAAAELQNEEGAEPHRQRRRQPSHGKLRL